MARRRTRRGRSRGSRSNDWKFIISTGILSIVTFFAMAYADPPKCKRGQRLIRIRGTETCVGNVAYNEVPPGTGNVTPNLLGAGGGALDPATGKQLQELRV